MKTLEVRKSEAAARQAQYNTLSLQEKLDLLNRDFPYPQSQRQRVRLESQIAKQNAAVIPLQVAKEAFEAVEKADKVVKIQGRQQHRKDQKKVRPMPQSGK